MKVVNIAQRTPEWHVWRKGGITGTDAAALLGLHAEKTPWRIWAEKLGKVIHEDISGNPNVRRGVELEPVAREAIEDKYGLMLLPFCGEHDEHGFLRASFDGIDDQGAPWEIKCPGDNVWDSVKTLGEAAAEYQRYYCQVQHQILVSGADAATLVFFHNGELLEFVVNRDDAMHQEIITKGQAFMALLESGKEPEKDPLKDIFVPAGADRGQWLTLAVERKSAVKELEALKGRAKAFETLMKKSEEGMIALMGDFLRAEADGISITRFSQQGSVDWKAVLAQVTPDLELSDEFLAPFRGAASMRTRITEKDTKDAEVIALSERKKRGKAKGKEQPALESKYAW